MECRARIVGNESEEGLPPRVIGVTEQLVPKRFKFFGADRTNGFGNGFAALLVEALKVEFFEWHRIQFTPIEYASPGNERNVDWAATEASVICVRYRREASSAMIPGRQDHPMSS
jgi:hypothetical protein